MDLDTVDVEIEDNIEVREFTTELFKHWFKAAGNAGFMSITPWEAAGKFTIDIGKVNPGTDAVMSNTKCFVDGVLLNTYLRSIVNGKADLLYPKRPQCPSNESLVVYGGSPAKKESRIFKVHHWGAKADSAGSPSGFAWKCGLFGGKVSDTGAIEPDWNDRKSADMIRISRQQMHEIQYRLDVELRSWAARNPKWYDTSKKK